MPVFQFLTIAAGFMVLVSAGRIGNRQGASPIFTCAKTSNAEICPETYCLCSSLAVVGVLQGTIQILEDVYETATYATTEAGDCPSTDAGSPVTTSSKTRSDCVPTPTILPSSTTNRPSSTQPVDWMITGTSSCFSNGQLYTTLSPLQTCGPSLTASNCVFSVSINGFENDEGTFNGCNCLTTWGPVPTSSLWISQSDFGGPGYCGGPICEVSPSTIRVGQSTSTAKYCSCDAFASLYSSSTYFQNPCLGYAYTAPVTGTCASSTSWGPGYGGGPIPYTVCDCTETGTSLPWTYSTSLIGACSSTVSWVVTKHLGDSH
ncbi:hypothetical protein HO173_006422 [Letharia columbiana]|uniref:Uncharacterized protein n=1 Tax=Letharia columbiana TaxID=112416 RepID=A0A8H6FV21_9LECA|nr:uncharacterized protein HO173_006422 [Letharia columbiana]KAF6235228.1 hypothetical protein HO173_006422 [Letharia columbiana]